jgi:outer membrane murein-binding lipoprotein Lpp
MALLGALGGLLLCGCVLAAVKSKKNGAAPKVKTLSLK